MVTPNGIVPARGGQFKLLSEEQIRDLHAATMEILQEVGVKVFHDDALEILRSNGCHVDFEKKIARIPEEVLMKYLGMAPSKVTLYGRDSRYDVVLDCSDDVYVMGGAGALHYIDLDGVRKPSTMAALEEFTRLEDTLENMDLAHFLLTPQEIAQEGHEMRVFAHMLKNNTRNFYALPGGCRKGIEFELAMAAVCAGSVAEVSRRPFMTEGLCVLSPLTHRHGLVEELWACGEHSIPVYVEADAAAGGTTPFTIAGCAVEVNANVLSAIALAR
jgi:trimethylamine--corrinoid protein Co-methyltransferase